MQCMRMNNQHFTYECTIVQYSVCQRLGSKSWNRNTASKEYPGSSQKIHHGWKSVHEMKNDVTGDIPITNRAQKTNYYKLLNLNLNWFLQADQVVAVVVAGAVHHLHRHPLQKPVAPSPPPGSA